MFRIHRSTTIALFAATCLMGCGAEGIASVSGSTPSTTSIAVGQEIQLTLSTVGPGSYDSLPSISSSAVRFLDMTFPPPQVPAGPTQVFRFVGATRGTAIVSFHQSFSNRVVEDTVVVQ